MDSTSGDMTGKTSTKRAMTPSTGARRQRQNLATTDGENAQPSEMREIGQQLLAQLPSRLQKDITYLMDESEQRIEVARTYVRENPREFLGIALGVGAFAWSLFGTTPGRRMAKWGAAIAMPYVTTWISERFEARDAGSESQRTEDEGQGSARGQSRDQAAGETSAGARTAGHSSRTADIAH